MVFCQAQPQLNRNRTRNTYDDLRSVRWFAADDLRSMCHRSRMKQMGLTGEDWHGKPVIAILNT